MTPHATKVAWGPNLQHPSYGTATTYTLAAGWLSGCETVADWGGSTGAFRAYLPPTVNYAVIDGTPQGYPTTWVADIVAPCQLQSDGVLIRHVLDHNRQWDQILRNMKQTCLWRAVVITFTPDAETTHVVRTKSGWPVINFCPDDLRLVMGAWLKSDMAVQTKHPERIYYLERPPC